MENVKSEDSIREDILGTAHRLFGIRALSVSPIHRGWLNLKWKVTADTGEFVFKQYSPRRYKLHGPEKLQLALERQAELHRRNLPCPRLLPYEGKLLLESDNGERFIAMEYCSGSRTAPGQFNIHQLYELGRATGRMHRLLNGGAPRPSLVPQFVPPSPEERTAHWDQALERAREAGRTELLADIHAQRDAVQQIDTALLRQVPTGWAHRDLWADNLLFHECGLAAILDFDRLDYDYPQLDLARAVMSCALEGEELDRSLVMALAEGYGDELPLNEGELVRSLQMLWYMESTWWIHEKIDLSSVPPARFAKEMNWLARHLDELPCLLGNA